MQYLKCFLRTKIHLLCFKYKLPKPKSLLFSHSTPFLNLNKAYSHPLFFPNPLNLSFYLYPHPPSMVDNKNKRMKSIGHISTSPKMKSKKEKEPTKGGLSNRGKHLAHSPLPPPYPKPTLWFVEEHYEVSYKFSYAKKEQIQPKYLDLVWLKCQGFVFP